MCHITRPDCHRSDNGLVVDATINNHYVALIRVDVRVILADVDAQVAATGTALALSAGGSDGANSDSESEGGLVFSNPLMWPAIIAISAGAVALSIFGVRVVRKRRSSR